MMSSVLKNNSIGTTRRIYMTTIDDNDFCCSYYETDKAMSNKVDNCAHVSMMIFAVNSSVFFFCLGIKKSLNIKKNYGDANIFTLTCEAQSIFCLRLKNLLVGNY